MEVVDSMRPQLESERALMRAAFSAAVTRARQALEWAEIMQVLIALHRGEQPPHKERAGAPLLAGDLAAAPVTPEATN
jgi:predicted protein tyrosine phosphatase